MILRSHLRGQIRRRSNSVSPDYKLPGENRVSEVARGPWPRHDSALVRRSKGSIASKAWEDRTVAALSSPGTLARMFWSARMRWERRIRQNVSPIGSTRWLSKTRRGCPYLSHTQ